MKKGLRRLLMAVLAVLAAGVIAAAGLIGFVYYKETHLPPVGDIHITGIVNISGILAQLTLQTTRISTVISLADTIARGLLPILNASGLIQTL